MQNRGITPSVVRNAIVHGTRAVGKEAGTTVLLGPAFIAKDVESYGAMAELEADQVDRFWKYIDALEEAARP